MMNWAVDRLFIKQPRLRRVMTRAIYGRSDIVISLLGAELTINAELENGYLRGFRHARRLSIFRDEAAALINLASLLSDGSTFVDAGANIGVYSAVMSRLSRLKRGITVMAFEVDPNTFSRLAENARRYGFYAHNVGLADAEITAQFVRGAVSHVTTSYAGRNSYNIDEETFSARCAPLETFDVPGESIIMKIDVEGFEYEVLLGARRFFTERRIKAVYFDGIAKLEQAQEFLKAYGFRLLDGRSLEPLGPRAFSILALRNDRRQDS